MVSGNDSSPNLTVTRAESMTSRSRTNRAQLSPPTKAMGSGEVRLKSVKENHSDAAIGAA